jgi:glutamate carboxypeptidase
MDSSKIQTAEMLSLLKQLVEIESPSHEKIAVDRVGSLIAERCRLLGGQVKVHSNSDHGNNLEVCFSPSPPVNPDSHHRKHSERKPPAEGSGKSILLLAHMDTVFPIGTLEHMPFYEKDGKVFGPGVSDMKGGIVVILTALRTALDSGKLRYPVTVLFTSDEETGSDTSRELIIRLASQSSLVLVLEPGMVDGSVKTWRKGVGEYSIVVTGRAAHAGGDHQKGRNAIEEMSRQVLAIQKLTDYEKGTTLNVGFISGGTASNVVPAECRIEVDLRVMQVAEAERIDSAIRELKPVLEGVHINVTGGLNRPPMPYNDTIRSTFEKVRTIAARENITLSASGTGGASDANFVASLGVPLLDGLGPAGGEYHSEREYLFKDSLLERARLLAAIFHEWQ